MGSGAGSHVSEIVEVLEEDLLQGRLLPGERLDERKLAARFRVSRTPVREALQRLAANGIVALPARQMASVVQLDVPELLYAFEVIAELEALAAALAARRMLTAERKLMEDANAACAKAAETADEVAFNAANHRFHDAIVTASRNPLLRAQVRKAQLLTTPYRRQITFLPGRMRASVDEHQAIIDAILVNDGEEARRRMRRHVNRLAEGAGDLLHHLRITPADSTA